MGRSRIRTSDGRVELLRRALGRRRQPQAVPPRHRRQRHAQPGHELPGRGRRHALHRLQPHGVAARQHRSGQAPLPALRGAGRSSVTFLAHTHAGVGNYAGNRIALAVLVLHVVAAAVWIGTVLLVVARRVTIRRVAPITSVAALTTILTGVVNARIHIDAPELLTHHAYGWVFLTKLGLVGTALVLARRVRRTSPPRLLRVEAGALALAAAAGMVLSVLPGLTSTLPGLSVVARPTNDPECLSEIHGAFAAVHEQRPASTLTFA